ncbi:hypothetical protein OSTOST_11628 [Ostertagia ostertagi]
MARTVRSQPNDVIPFLKPFRKMDSRGEPIRAIFVTILICWMGILIAVIENITALITQSLSMLGAFLCVWGGSDVHLGMALCTSRIFIGAAVYKYIEYAGAEKEWGDGIRGLGLSAARFALLNVDPKPQHSRNWRPQLLVLLENTDSPNTHGMLSFVSQLKAGKGLTLVAMCTEGEFARDAEQAAAQQRNLDTLMKKNKIKGFGDILVTEHIMEGVSCLVQTSGLGALRHNTVVISWPEQWHTEHSWNVGHRFVSALRACSAAKCAILVPKNVERFPPSNTKVSGNLDVWWVVHDGGLLMLLPFLLRQHKTWKNAVIRLFAIAQLEDNNVQMKSDLEKFLYHLRIEAEVFVIEMPDSDISDYTYERTLKMEERTKLLKNLNKADREKDLQTHIEEVVRERKLSKINEEEMVSITLFIASCKF